MLDSSASYSPLSHRRQLQDQQQQRLVEEQHLLHAPAQERGPVPRQTDVGEEHVTRAEREGRRHEGSRSPPRGGGSAKPEKQDRQKGAVSAR